MKNRILAVVVTYYPEKDLLLKNIIAFIEHVDKVLIWENTPERQKMQYRYIEDEKIKYCGDGINSISHALNYAWRYGKNNDYDYLLTMDQDSVFLNFPAYINSILCSENKCNAIFSPSIIAEGQEFKPAKTIQKLDYCITSGMLVSLRVLNSIGAYEEKFRIDGIDEDLCLKAKEKGIYTYHVAEAALIQRFGKQEIRGFLGRKYMVYNYPAHRLRSIYKTHIILLRKYTLPPMMKRTVLRFYFKEIPLTILLFEKEKYSKYWNIFSGIIKGCVTPINPH